MGRKGNTKGRSSQTYQNKIRKIKAWYIQREKWRKLRQEKAQKEKKTINLKPLKPLEWYIEQIKQPNKTR
jgi:hypothetical protein